MPNLSAAVITVNMLEEMMKERNAYRDEVDEARSILAGMDISSLPNDMPLCRVASARIGDLQVLRDQRDEYLTDVVRLRAALREVKRMVDPSRWEHINAIAKMDDAALSGKGES